MTTRELDSLAIGRSVVEIVEGDITDLATDAIVNAANRELVLGGGVAGAIRRRGGSRIQEECDRHGPIETGQAAITTGGQLPARHVIHAVGPRMGEGSEQKKIAAAVTGSLRLAGGKGWRSVAFPAISTGLFMVPAGVCAEAFRQAVEAFWKANPSTSVKMVWLCLTVNHYDRFESVLRGA